MEAAAEEQRQAEARELERKAAAEARVAAEAEANAREKEDKQRERRRQEQLGGAEQDSERQQALAAACAAMPLQPIEQPKTGASVKTPEQRALRHNGYESSLSRGRPGAGWHPALASWFSCRRQLCGTWWALRPNSTPTPPTRQQQVGRPPASNVPPRPSQTVNSGESVTQTVPDNPSQPTEPHEVNQPPPAVEHLPLSRLRNRRQSLRRSRLRAIGKARCQSGRIANARGLSEHCESAIAGRPLVQALDAAAAGLKIDPRDPTLNTVMRTLLREAQEDAARSKQDATDLDAAAVRAEEAFNQGLLRETQAVEPATDGQD